jgi:hypothetical protein
MNVAGRVFRSSAIVKHHDCTTIESEDGCPIRLAGPFNIAKTRENGFSEKVIDMIGLQVLEFWKVHCYYGQLCAPVRYILFALIL